MEGAIAMLRHLSFAVAIALGLSALPAAAQELFGGAYVHGADTPLSPSTGEHGLDLQVGYRFAPIDRLSVIGKPSPYLIASANTSGGTSFVGAGLSWKIGLGRSRGALYLRPGLGFTINNAPSYRVDRASRYRTDLGSRVLFEPELAIGTRLTPRLGLEASWVHVSHAGLFNSEQNPGLDMLGLRMTYALN
jgi:lipid A 3-O-deacylase